MEGKNKVIAIGSDHAGYILKEFLKNELKKKEYKLIDFGPDSEESIDYPDTIHPLADSIDKKEIDIGLIICGSGNGASMTANKYQNVRAALCWNEEITVMARQHNDANILALPARYIEKEDALKMTEIFLITEFEGGRHKRRIHKIPISK